MNTETSVEELINDLVHHEHDEEDRLDILRTIALRTRRLVRENDNLKAENQSLRMENVNRRLETVEKENAYLRKKIEKMKHVPKKSNRRECSVCKTRTYYACTRCDSRPPLCKPSDEKNCFKRYHDTIGSVIWR